MDISKGTVTIKRNVYGAGPIKTLPPTELVKELTDNNSDLNGSFQTSPEGFGKLGQIGASHQIIRSLVQKVQGVKKNKWFPGNWSCD